ncbi:MAG: ATPase [Bacteroidales bacterium]|jgi:N-acetylglucosamine kinase-like BadF-type ATPase|nr:ATPase [Bacteroidales bacterium]
MILIADSGSTKTHWKLLKKDNTLETHYTKGLNPFFTDKNVFSEVINHGLPIPKDQVEALHFYGSGCGTEGMIAVVKEYLHESFPTAAISVYGDLFGAARAMLGNQKGIACILGTGSVSCVYDGQKIIRGIPSLGYILGDEGGGVTLGRELLKAFFYHELPEHLHAAFTETYHLTREMMLENVYHRPAPNAYLATFTKFIRTYQQDPFIHNLVYRCFDIFFKNHVQVYPEHKELPLVFTGSVSSNMKDILVEVAAAYGTTISTIMKEPMEGLVAFHLQNDR